MSYLMDYGPDWPPEPTPAHKHPAVQRRWPLWKRCLFWIGVYVVIAVLGLIAVHLRGPMPLDPQTPSTPMSHPTAIRL